MWLANICHIGSTSIDEIFMVMVVAYDLPESGSKSVYQDECSEPVCEACGESDYHEECEVEITCGRCGWEGLAADGCRCWERDA